MPNFSITINRPYFINVLEIMQYLNGRLEEIYFKINKNKFYVYDKQFNVYCINKDIGCSMNLDLKISFKILLLLLQNCSDNEFVLSLSLNDTSTIKIIASSLGASTIKSECVESYNIFSKLDYDISTPNFNCEKLNIEYLSHALICASADKYSPNHSVWMHKEGIEQGYGGASSVCIYKGGNIVPKNEFDCFYFEPFVLDILKKLRTQEKNFRLTKSSNQLFLYNENLLFKIPLRTNNFYRQYVAFISKVNETKEKFSFTVDSCILKNKLNKMQNLFFNDDLYRVNVKINSQKMIFTLNTSLLSYVEEIEISTKYALEAYFKFDINIKLFYKILQACGDEVKIKIIHKESAIILKITSTEEDYYLCSYRLEGKNEYCE